MSSQKQGKVMAVIGHAVHKVIGSCRDTGELTSRAMDERLPFGRRVQLKMHLALCAFCRRNATQLAMIRRLLRLENGVAEPNPVQLSDSARQRVQERLNENLR